MTSMKAFLEIFYGILNEKEKHTEAHCSYQDDLIQKESERIKKRSDAEKEAWMKEKEKDASEKLAYPFCGEKGFRFACQVENRIEVCAFNKWVETRQEVKSAEAKVIQETEEALKRRQAAVKRDAKTGGSVEEVWEAWSQLEKEAQHIANESARNSRDMSSGSISGMSW
jgi:ectoine hydroxylase-related dioxygenase (phytanoyl-CoA dioxygenase family)